LSELGDTDTGQVLSSAFYSWLDCKEFKYKKDVKFMKGYPYSYYVALDGNGINGLEGMAGMCLFLYDPETNNYAYKIKYYDGASAGHWVGVNPSGTVGFLGNAGQHLLFFDAETLDEIDRISTLRFETNDTSLRGSTHVV